jgi:hypothetical protein
VQELALHQLHQRRIQDPVVNDGDGGPQEEQAGFRSDRGTIGRLFATVMGLQKEGEEGNAKAQCEALFEMVLRCCGSSGHLVNVTFLQLALTSAAHQHLSTGCCSLSMTAQSSSTRALTW